MFKKIFIGLYLSILSMGVFNVNTHNANDSIVVNDKKIPLRQYSNIKKENNVGAPEEANIETTNVDYDLRYLFGGENNYIKFNLNSLVPKKENSNDISYKFICAKPVNQNLYLYVYHENNNNDEILNARFTISKSKVQNEKTGEFEELYSTYNARFINSYGYKQRFIKFAIDNIINLEDDVRCNIKNFSIVYKRSNGRNYSTSELIVGDEFAFKVGGNDDFISEYWQNEYVRVTLGEPILNLVEKNRISYSFGDFYNSYDENFYYFFNTDHAIDELIEVTYDYQYLTYDAEMQVAEGQSDYDFYSLTERQCYTGLYKNGNGEKSNLGANESKPNKIEQVEDIKPFYNQKVGKRSYVEDVSRPYFLWWNKKVTYKMDTIVDCLNVDSYENDEYVNLKQFVNNVQNDQVKKGQAKYQWAFLMKKDIRETIGGRNDGWWWFEKKFYSTSRCHEVMSGMIVYLKFRTNGINFEFNVLDIPRDTSKVYLGYVPYETLQDEIWNNVSNGINWLKDSFNKILDNLVPIAILVITIILFVIFYPFILSIGSIFKASTDSLVTNMKTNNQKKKNEIEVEEKKNE